MGAEFWEVVCDEHAIGGSGEYCGGSYAHLGRMGVYSHGALGVKCVPRAVIFDLEPGVIGSVVSLSRRSANSSSRTTS
jgi:tubulin beta